MSSTAVTAKAVTDLTIPMKPTTWLERLEGDEVSVRLNRIHNEVVNQFKITQDRLDGDKLSDISIERMMTSIADLPLDAMITFCPVSDNIDVLHHTSKIGGDILNKVITYFSLTGAGETAVPVVYKPSSALKVTEIQCPTWSTLNGVTNEGELDTAPLARTKTKVTSAQPIPPFLAAAVLKMDHPTPAKVFLHLKDVAEKEQTNEGDPTGTEPVATSLKVILPFLWAVHKGLIPPVAKQCSFAPAIKQKTDNLHQLLHKHKERPTQPHPDGNALEKVTRSLDQIVEKGLMNSASPEAPTNKKSFEHRLSSISKTLILTASAPNSSTIPTEPSPTARDFFEQKNAAEAKAFLYHQLIIIRKLPLHLQAGLATAMYSGYFFWDTMGTPSNFSLFLVPPESGATVSDTADSIALSLKSSDGRGGIDSEDIKRLTKQKIFIPTTINELEHHLNNAIHILSIVFHKEAFLVDQLTTCLVHIQRNQATYCDLQRNDNLFAARLLYVVDVRVQNFFREAQQGNFDPEPLDFSRTFEEIVHNRTFKAHLPSCIHNYKTKRERDTEREKQPKKARGEVVHNKDIVTEWRIRPDEKYKEVFHPNTTKIPKRNGKPICCKMQTLGHCNSSCKLDHDKIERGSKTFNEYDKFVKGCREGNF
jgi:hypothetical protein